MPKWISGVLRASPALYAAAVLADTAASAIDSAAVKKLLAHPTREYATAPLWVWNDMLTEAHVRDTMRDLAGQQVRQVFVHPRPGLMTPYLSADWFRLWRLALKEAHKLDMNVWIYDENSYPSGFAGGWVPELMPESRGLGLSLRETQSPPKPEGNILAVFRLDGEEHSHIEDVTARVKAGESLPQARYLTASVQRAGDSPWHGNRCYVNLLTPGVTEKFIETTLEAYRREFGREFGKRIPGVFTDEPNIRPAGGLPWCEDLPQQFERRWGYGLIENLPSLTLELGDWRRVRHNYFATLNDLFIERWAKPYSEWCERSHLEFTGHYWDHEWPNCGGVPDNMAMYAWHQRPAIDCLMNQYAEHTHAQFGNIRMVKELSSIANQLGRKRTLCEIYGAGGWDLRFEDMKRIADWLAVLGVNTMDEHLSYITLRGARKRDHPQSFSYHEPWWEAYHVSESYLTRLSALLSQGEQINRVLVIEPTTTAWMYQANEAKLKELGHSFFKLLQAFEAAQVEYDLGSEDVMARYGSVRGKTLRVGQRNYWTVVIPPHTDNLNSPTLRLLEGFKSAGGELIVDPSLFADDEPARVDGTAADWLLGLVDPNDTSVLRSLQAPVLPFTAKHLAAAKGFTIARTAGDRGMLFHMRRELEDGQTLFLVNTSIEAPSEGLVESELRGVEQWNLNSGEVSPYPFEKTDEGIKFSYRLPPSGSLLLFLSQKPVRAPRGTTIETTLTTTLPGPVQVYRLGPNVLTLDYVDITAGGETRTSQYFYQANRFAWQKNGMDRNPWDSAVQFKDELVTKQFPPGSGFTASYRFSIEGAIPKNLAIVVERPDLYTITCNGRPIAAGSGDWWLDKAFGRIDLGSAARIGENVVTIKATPFTMFHELEPAYVLGDFALRPAEKGFVITPDRALKPGKWNEQGHPFYAQGVAYRQQFRTDTPIGRYFVVLPNWYGSVAKVNVNGALAGYVTAPPWECEVTKRLKRGNNTIEVVVIGTLKNTLGPHHGQAALGSAWPGMFQNGPRDGPPPGKEYANVGYGLFEPFVLKQIVRR
jgi:hypothetical protein